MAALYRQLMGHSRAVVRQAETAVQHVAAGAVRAVGLAQLEVEGLAQQLRDTGHLVRPVLAQTRARQVIGVMNPILRGWVNYFRVGNATGCSGYVKESVEKKVRRHLCVNRWSTAPIYSVLGVFRDYRVQYQVRA